MIRRLALVLACLLGATTLASCRNTLTDAATITFTDARGQHTVHITRTRLLDDVREIIGSSRYRDVLSGAKLVGDADNTTDSRLTAFWLTQLIDQVVVDSEFNSQRLKASGDNTDAVNEAASRIGQQLGFPDASSSLAAFKTLSKSLQATLVAGQVRTDEVFTSCPSHKLVAHILFKTEAEANAALAQIHKDPSQFGALARTKSIDTASRANSGALGCLAPDEFVKEFQAAADAAPLNTEVGPVHTQFGYHIIYVTRWLASDAQTFSQGLQQAVDVVLKQRLHDLHVRVDPQFGSWQSQTDSQGNPTFGVSPPKFTPPRAQREKR